MTVSVFTGLHHESCLRSQFTMSCRVDLRSAHVCVSAPRRLCEQQACLQIGAAAEGCTGHLWRWATKLVPPFGVQFTVSDKKNLAQVFLSALTLLHKPCISYSQTRKYTMPTPSLPCMQLNMCRHLFPFEIRRHYFYTQPTPACATKHMQAPVPL